MKNSIINITRNLCQIIQLFLGLYLIVLTIVCVSSRATSATPGNIEISPYFVSGFGGTITIRSCGDCLSENQLYHLDSGWLAWLYFREGLVVILMVLITGGLISILNSLGDFKTFYDSNIEQFLKLARYGFIAFIIASFNIGPSEVSGVHLDLTFAMGPLLFALGSLILAEIFREGKSLLEESKTIV